MFGIELSAQMYIFIKSIALGFMIGFIYNLFMLFRISFIKNIFSVFLQDIVFFVGAGILTFLFVFETNYGQLRFYIFAGELIGFCLYYFFPSRLVNLLWKKADNSIKKHIGKVFDCLLKPLKRIKIKLPKRKTEEKKQKEQKKTKKFFYFAINLLHKKKEVLYNNKK